MYFMNLESHIKAITIHRKYMDKIVSVDSKARNTFSSIANAGTEEWPHRKCTRLVARQKSMAH